MKLHEKSSLTILLVMKLHETSFLYHYHPQCSHETSWKLIFIILLSSTNLRNPMKTSWYFMFRKHETEKNASSFMKFHEITHGASWGSYHISTKRSPGFGLSWTSYHETISYMDLVYERLFISWKNVSINYVSLVFQETKKWSLDWEP